MVATVPRQCDYVKCDNIYDAEVRYLNRGQGIYCSKGCSASAQTGVRRVEHEPNVTCGYCDKPFYKKPSSLKNSKSGIYFCCKEHQSLGFSDPGVPVTPGPERTGRAVSLCEMCEVKPTRNQFCKGCTRLRKIDAWLNGDVTVTWSGKSREPAGWVKTYIVDVRGDICESCGFNERHPDGNSIIQMDHIDGDYLNNNIENLRLLCPNCHAMTKTYGARNMGNGRRHRKKYYLSNIE